MLAIFISNWDLIGLLLGLGVVLAIVYFLRKNFVTQNDEDDEVDEKTAAEESLETMIVHEDVILDEKDIEKEVARDDYDLEDKELEEKKERKE